MKAVFTGRARWRDQSGFGLIEVMVSAMVVVLIATATVSSISQSQKVSGRTLARGIRANLAEQDQERMRAMRATDLAKGYTATKTVAQQGINYQVDSKAEFVQDANGATVSCTSTGSQSSFLKLTSTVTPQASLATKPLVVTSLYALPIAQYSPTAGTLIVKVAKADGITPQPGVTTTVTGPDNPSSITTNSLGCAVYQFLTPGAYSILLSAPGYVDKSLNPTVTFSGTVTAGNINQATAQIYDQAGRITYTLDSPRNDGHVEPTHPGTTIKINAGGLLPSGSTTRASNTNGTTDVDGLFPFTAPYLAHTGTCAENDPTAAHPNATPTVAADPNYYTSPASHVGFGSQTVAPGGGYTQKLREPVINTKILTTPSGTPVNVKITQAEGTGSTCTTSYTTTTYPDGTLVRAGFPYGVYTICASATFNGNKVFRQTFTVRNTSFDGAGTPAAPIINATLSNSTPTNTQGACP